MKNKSGAIRAAKQEEDESRASEESRGSKRPRTDLQSKKRATGKDPRFLRGKSFRVPQSVWPNEKLPAVGYWVAEFDRFADKQRNTWLVSEGVKFWVATTEVQSWQVHE